ncbi:CD72 protein, partial [Catharus fuscescens]|nr:CD72 protein [Catharus fuscescens]
MAQSVVYADLKFAAGPPPTVPDDDDSPYENVPLGPVTAAPSPGRWTRRWRDPTALLAASLLLLLLLLVAVVALGACYWQVSRSLQDASRQHTTEQGRLSQALRSQEQSREQTQLELSRARGELQRLWHEYNITQMELEKRNSELERRNSELGHTLEELAVLQEEMQVVQGRLNTSESTVSSLRACVNTDCCPAGWVLYKSKCLYISVTNKTWQQSSQDCENQSAHLLVQ